LARTALWRAYRDCCARTARFIELPELLAFFERKRPSRQTG
jgi:hypothetical protein